LIIIYICTNTNILTLSFGEKQFVCALHTTLLFRVEYLCWFIIITIILCKHEFTFVLLFSQFSMVLIVKILKYSRVRHARFSFGCNNYFVQTVLQQTNRHKRRTIPPAIRPTITAYMRVCVRKRISNKFRAFLVPGLLHYLAEPHSSVFHLHILYFMYQQTIIKAHTVYLNVYALSMSNVFFVHSNFDTVYINLEYP